MELFAALGLDIKILIAQFVNFAILIFVLYKFGYKPMFKFLEERKGKIEKGIKDSEKASKKLIEAEKQFDDKLHEAKKEAAQILEQASEQAEKRKKEILEKAKNEVGELINQGKATIQLEKEKVLKDIKKEVAELSVLVAGKILEEKIDSKTDKELIEKALKNNL